MPAQLLCNTKIDYSTLPGSALPFTIELDLENSIGISIQTFCVRTKLQLPDLELHTILYGEGLILGSPQQNVFIFPVLTFGLTVIGTETAADW